MHRLLAILNATRDGDLDALRALFEGDAAFPNVRDECGDTVLAHAIDQGPLALVAALLELGAEADFDGAGGFPALFAAIDRPAPDRHEVLRMLMDAGADVEHRGVNDWTPLHFAANRDDAEAMRILLARGADPRARTRIDHYDTPLDEAERRRSAAAAAVLREWIEHHPSPPP